MSITQALVLGIIQGLTEFLPISSSGHLALTEAFWSIPLDAESLQGFDVILHAGTLAALVVCYAGTWWKLLGSLFSDNHRYRSLLLAIIVATIPAVIAGIFLHELIAYPLRSPLSIGLSFILTAMVLLLGERFPEQRRNVQLPRMQALWIGCAQACALVPGLSRSGLTISAGRMAGLSRKEALDFSFLMALPVIAGATILTLNDAVAGNVFLPEPPMLAAGFLSSLIVSIFAILFLRRWVISRSLGWFAIYLIPVGLFLVLSQFL